MAVRHQFDPDEFALELSERLREMSRAPNIKKYEPHEKQYIFHKSNQKRKLYIGGNRSGKTTGGVTEAIWRATCTHPYRPDLNALGPTRGRVIAVSFVEGVEKIIFPQYKQWLYPSALKGGSWDTAYHKATRTLHFANGSTIEFMSYDQDLEKFAGTSRHWIHFDEEPPKAIYDENLARLIDTNGEFWITMTPVEGMTWIYDELYEPYIDLPEEERKVLIVEINTLENPYLDQEAIETFLDGVSEDQAGIRIQGKFVQVGGRIYGNFDPTPGGINVLKEPIEKPGELLKDWYWVLAMDHGLNNPTAALWVAFDPNGFAVLFDEYYMNERTVDQNAYAIRQKIVEHGRAPDLFVADPSIAMRNGVSGTSIQQEYAKYGLHWTLGNNSVKDGLIRVKKYFNAHKYVNNRNNYYDTPHFLFTPELAANKKKHQVQDSPNALNNHADLEFSLLRITPNCAKTIWELKKYRWKTYQSKKLQYENNPYDEPHKKDDHACDALRYCIMSQPDLHAEGSIERGRDFKNKVDSVMSELGLGDNEYFGITDSYNRDVADPFDRAMGYSSTVPVGGDWSYDEHMGGAY